MGVQLVLIPIDFEDGMGLSGRGLLECENRGIKDLTDELPGATASRPLWCHVAQNDEGETCYGEVTEDCYGDPIKVCKCRDLLTIRNEECIQSSAWNRAAWAFLADLPPDADVALYWQ